jgi:hypothetical protein
VVGFLNEGFSPITQISKARGFSFSTFFQFQKPLNLIKKWGWIPYINIYS